MPYHHYAINPLLASVPTGDRYFSPVPIRWDIRRVPHRAAALSQLATIPGIPSLHLTSDLLSEQWNLSVYNPTGVTVEDILDCHTQRVPRTPHHARMGEDGVEAARTHPRHVLRALQICYQGALVLQSLNGHSLRRVIALILYDSRIHLGALWDRTRLALAITLRELYALFSSASTIVPVPGITSCSTTSQSRIIVWAYVLLVIGETEILLSTLYRSVQHYREVGGRSRLLTILVNHNAWYFGCSLIGRRTFKLNLTLFMSSFVRISMTFPATGSIWAERECQILWYIEQCIVKGPRNQPVLVTFKSQAFKTHRQISDAYSNCPLKSISLFCSASSVAVILMIAFLLDPYNDLLGSPTCNTGYSDAPFPVEIGPEEESANSG
ncbi:hypothetical protein BU15DRAFT_65298 [Melanogaster broomeanus]|nr:hypothetical protein BU15DRAFT_65298 [Melanogaster broomeanus]